MTKITHAHLDWNDSGTPVSEQFDDVYFSNVNGLEETRYVFLRQNQLPQRWLETDEKRFVIGETGFGTGLNFLATWQWFEQFRQQHPDAPLQSLHFISFEKFPLNKSDLVKAHQAWPELAHYAEQLQQHYPIAAPECHRIVLADGMVTLDLWFGDIKECMPKVPTPETGIIDAWFLDGFAPSKNPDMWSQELFNGMAQLAKYQCSCATFTAAGFVRRGLIEAGFEMKKVKGFGTKRDMLAGSMQVKTPYTNISPCYAMPPVSNLQDVAIIGGGIASASLAKALSDRGISVTLYCKDAQPAQGASGNRQGAIYPLINHSHDAISRFFTSAFIYSRQFINHAAQSLKFDHDWCGVTQLMWDEKSTRKLQRLGDGQFPSELVTRFTSGQTCLSLGVPVSSPSIHYPLGGWLCPAQLTEQLISRLTQNQKLTTHFNCEINEITWDDSEKHWLLTSGDQRFTHQTVVIANGHLFDQLSPSSKLPLGKVKGQVSHIPTTDALKQLNNVLCYDGYMTPINPNNGHHCIGASYDRSQLNNDFDPDAQRINKQKLINCVNDQNWPKGVNVEDGLSRQGVRCVSRDHLPFVGNIGELDIIRHQYKASSGFKGSPIDEVHHYPNLYAFLGLGSRGLSSAPLLGELLASIICNDPLPLPVDILEKLHPSRMWVRKLLKGKAV
ncbi:bifunctional tRNA (5-methylaminomethyl-2-thiouridine)(34)-methyltransferase MnmD/FAD-dependent 5-carboxymethylaminomethyl-2-thiouridine(34) oxidoreductase MnmC [Vibrio sp. WJH972]